MLASSESIFTENENLKDEVQGLRLLVEKEREVKKLYEEEISRLYEILNDLKRSKFGKKSERWESLEQMVFNEAEVESRKPDPLGEDEDSEEKITVKGPFKEWLIAYFWGRKVDIFRQKYLNFRKHTG
jgi:hypothetical protein